MLYVFEHFVLFVQNYIFFLQECEFNIEQALMLTGAPPASVNRLQSRRAKCRTALLQTNDPPENAPCPAANNSRPATEITSCPTGRSAFHSDLVSVSSTQELGRHMIVRIVTLL